MGKGESVIQFRMRIEGGRDIQPEFAVLRPAEPVGEIFDRKGVAVFPGKHSVHLMPLKTDPQSSGNQPQGHIQVASQL